MPRTPPPRTWSSSPSQPPRPACSASRRPSIWLWRPSPCWAGSDTPGSTIYTSTGVARSASPRSSGPPSRAGAAAWVRSPGPRPGRRACSSRPNPQDFGRRSRTSWCRSDMSTRSNDGARLPMPASSRRTTRPLTVGARTQTEQVIIAQEFEREGIERISIDRRMGIANHPCPRNRRQRERFVVPTQRGEIAWCQLFSEPDAGSDLASLATRAERVHGGWQLNGQKVWTSNAQQADWGICLARTDRRRPSTAG